jgi:hypothetical protein
MESFLIRAARGAQNERREKCEYDEHVEQIHGLPWLQHELLVMSAES